MNAYTKEMDRIQEEWNRINRTEWIWTVAAWLIVGLGVLAFVCREEWVKWLA